MLNNEVAEQRNEDLIEASIDVEIVKGELSKLTEETATRLLAGINYVKKRRIFNPAKKSVDSIISSFFSNYYDLASRTPNQKAVSELAEILVSKVETISVNELIETAQRLVNEAPENEIMLWISKEKIHELNLVSPISNNSNEFMIKLVMLFAKKAGKKVTVISNEDALRYKSIYVVDDAIYSGRQLSSHLLDLVADVKQPLNINLFCARSTERGILRVRETLGANKHIQLKSTVGKVTKSVFDALADEPEALAYFLAVGIAPPLEYRQPLNKVLAYAMEYVGTRTLTLSETKMPDFLSFLPEVAKGIKATPEEKHYPVLQFKYN